MKNILKNQSGAMSLDFMFALVFFLGTSVVFGMFCFTLSLVEIIQYTAYSSSRAYFAGHIDKKHQDDLARAVFSKLTEGNRSKDNFKFFLAKNRDWFDIQIQIGDFSSQYGRQQPTDVLEGVRLQVKAKILEFAVPFLGSTVKNGYTTNVTSFLGREVTTSECLQMVQQRAALIQALDTNRYGQATNMTNTYYAFDDNGC